MKRYILVLLISLSFAVQSQPKQPVTEADYSNTNIEMADKMRAEGKIYVVVAILATILAGFIVYTVSIDRKIAGLEKELKKDAERRQ